MYIDTVRYVPGARDLVKLTIVIGAATKPGRLSRAAGTFAADASAHCEVATIDLAATTIDVCDGRPLDDLSAPAQMAVEQIASADAVAFFAPTYRASYPGVLKNLLDQLPLAALRNTTVGVVAMGASDHHYLGVDQQLRPVLGWFGAQVAPVSVYLTGRDFGDDGELAENRRAELADLAATLLAMAQALGGRELGPAPLAAKAGG
jgi:FMN reductase